MSIGIYNKGSVQQRNCVIKEQYNKFSVNKETLSIEMYNKGTVQQKDCVTKGLNNKEIVQ